MAPCRLVTLCGHLQGPVILGGESIFFSDEGPLVVRASQAVGSIPLLVMNAMHHARHHASKSWRPLQMHGWVNETFIPLLCRITGLLFHPTKTLQKSPKQISPSYPELLYKLCKSLCMAWRKSPLFDFWGLCNIMVIVTTFLSGWYCSSYKLTYWAWIELLESAAAFSSNASKTNWLGVGRRVKCDGNWNSNCSLHFRGSY
jgi:hypothetical protein